ncbi:MAG: laccase domain-containing protein [Gammaproteobacteria bacterium]|nr:laccase domain-containing protein [Gammaproteobacteria bacterium]
MTRGRTAFSIAADGDLRSDAEARDAFAAALGISSEWATVRQVHGGAVVHVDRPGDAGAADALFTTVPGLPVAIFTADCYAVALLCDRGVGIAHAGWRGLAERVVHNLREAMIDAGVAPTRAVIGPGIGPCCFEVGEEVSAVFDGHEAVTTSGTPSVDLAGVVRDELDGLDWWEDRGCTRCGRGFFSHRRDGTTKRMAGVAWLP